ncbi:MAG: Ku protein [Desulfobacteraceae bacterium]|nr:Ku protein [Desulfobacteraceae bacterium]
MPRAIWKGSITFGLVNVPVALYPAENRSELHFSLLDRRNNAHVRYRRVNEITGEEVPWSEIVKAYEIEEGEAVILDEDDFKRAEVESTQAVEIEDFVDLDAIGYVYFDKPYYLVPGKRGEKGYALLRETLRRTGKVGIAKVVIRTRQYLAALIPEGDALVLDLLRFHQELRSPAQLELPGRDLAQYNVSDRELAMAEKLVEAMSSEWQPGKYHDDYRETLMKWIERKAKEGAAALPSPEELAAARAPGAEVIDISELLRKSVEQTARERGREEAAPRKSRRKEPAEA